MAKVRALKYLVYCSAIGRSPQPITGQRGEGVGDSSTGKMATVENAANLIYTGGKWRTSARKGKVKCGKKRFRIAEMEMGAGEGRYETPWVISS